MHPWTNDLGWVLSPLDNVFVAKMDSVANDTNQLDDWLQSRGIPNLFMLPKNRKNDRRAPKLEFGAHNEVCFFSFFVFVLFLFCIVGSMSDPIMEESVYILIAQGTILKRAPNHRATPEGHHDDAHARSFLCCEKIELSNCAHCSITSPC
jgi:hypothetical protein